eukprot:4485263-Lingulodinium_polyedra.AAC.1
MSLAQDVPCTSACAWRKRSLAQSFSHACLSLAQAAPCTSACAWRKKAPSAGSQTCMREPCAGCAVHICTCTEEKGA